MDGKDGQYQGCKIVVAWRFQLRKTIADALHTGMYSINTHSKASVVYDICVDVQDAFKHNVGMLFRLCLFPLRKLLPMAIIVTALCQSLLSFSYKLKTMPCARARVCV